MSDLIKFSSQGKISALVELYNKNKFKVFKVAYLLTNLVDDANQAVKYAFLDVWEYVLSSKIKSEEEFENTVINKAVFYCRSKILSDNSKAFKVPENNNFTSVKYLKQKDCENITKAELVLKSLPDFHRFVFVLRDYAGFPTNKIAQILKTNKETIEIALKTREINFNNIFKANFKETDISFDFIKEIEAFDLDSSNLKETDFVIENKIKEIALPFVKYKNIKTIKKGIIIGVIAALVVILGIFFISYIGKNDIEKTEQSGQSEEIITDVSGLEPTHYAEIDIKDYGKITVALDGNIAPKTVENFVSLANDGFYNGITFHRIMEGFMMQGGDPDGDGIGGSEKEIVGEFSANGFNNPISHTRGAISMARTNDPNSASSQFFIMHKDSTSLDGNYAAFGYVTEGIEVVDKICEDSKPTDNNGTIPKEKQPIINSIKITKVI